MRSEQLDLASYDTDKIANGCMLSYDPVFDPIADKEVTLLEVGVHRGGSLELWRDYFPRGTIVGIDLKDPPPSSDRIHTFRGSQTDLEFLTHVAEQTAPDGFDIIIDDASHLGETTKITFWHLFDNHLKPGGIYVVEDWPAGYWDDWPDGKCLDLEKHLAPAQDTPVSAASDGIFRRLLNRIRRKRPLAGHGYGMVGFVKQLVDEQAAADITRKTLKNPPGRPSRFENLLFNPSQVFVTKRQTG